MTRASTSGTSSGTAATLLLLGALAALLCSAVALPMPEPEPEPQPEPKIHIKIHMPKIHMPKIHINLKAPKILKLEKCVKQQLPKLPGAVGGALLGCVPSALGGAGPFGVCVAGKGVMSAARATSHIAVCMG